MLLHQSIHFIVIFKYKITLHVRFDIPENTSDITGSFREREISGIDCV
jgi:hypothetical protein